MKQANITYKETPHFSNPYSKLEDTSSMQVDEEVNATIKKNTERANVEISLIPMTTYFKNASKWAPRKITVEQDLKNRFSKTAFSHPDQRELLCDNISRGILLPQTPELTVL